MAVIVASGEGHLRRVQIRKYLNIHLRQVAHQVPLCLVLSGGRKPCKVQSIAPDSPRIYKPVQRYWKN
jgi:hypothetical protein